MGGHLGITYNRDCTGLPEQESSLGCGQRRDLPELYYPPHLLTHTPLAKQVPILLLNKFYWLKLSHVAISDYEVRDIWELD